MGNAPNMRPLLFLAFVSCARRIPDHLLLSPTTAAEVPESALKEPADVLRYTLRGDPLARTPATPPPDALATSGASPAYRSWEQAVRQLEQGTGDAASALQRVEDDWPNTEAVALSRGYRLRLIQGILAADPELHQEEALVLLSRVRPGSSTTPPPGAPLAWLSPPDAGSDPVLRYADRWVLQGWLSGPAVDVAPVAEALGGVALDRLRDHPLGAALIARGSGASGDPSPALEALRLATRLALERAAADRDGEQDDCAELRDAEAAKIGGADPIGHHLDAAVAAAAPIAKDDRAAGVVVLGVHARRWYGGCADEPCTGLDRSEAFGVAGRYDAEVARIASVWQVIALKEAIDTMDVGHDTVMFPRAMVDLLDALLGTGAGPFDADLLRTRKPDAVTWLALGRALGTDACTDWASARASLGVHLANAVSAVRAGRTDPREVELLDRIARRATR